MLGLGLALTDGAARSRGGPGAPSRPTVVVIEGDSITAYPDPPSYARLWAADHGTLTIRNLAVGGSQLPDLRNRAAAAMAEQPTHLSVMIGANDLSADTATYLADLWAYTDPFRAAGAKIIVGTVLPRTSASGWSAKRAAFNAALRDAVGVKIDAIYDFDSCPMGVDGAQNDGARYPDGLHPSAIGHGELKRVYSSVMNGMLGIPNEPLDFAFAPTAGAAADSDHDSDGYVVTGLWLAETRPFAISPGGRVSKNGGAFVPDGSGDVGNGDTLRVRARSSADAATQTDVTLTIGATAATYSVTTAGAGTRDWLPTDLGAKLKLWLRPEEIAGANASQMDDWPDASGDAVAVTAAGYGSKPTVVAAGPNGLKAVRFDIAYNQARFMLPAGYLTGRTAGAAFFVAKLVADPPSAAFGPPVGGWGANGDGEFYPYVNGSVYSSYGTNARHQTPDVGPSLAAWRIASFHSAPNDWRYYVDGAAIHVLLANTFANGTAPAIGFDPVSGNALDGQIAELIDCAAVLTTAERQRVEGYLAWKYDLAANLPAGHPYANEKPTL